MKELFFIFAISFSYISIAQTNNPEVIKPKIKEWNNINFEGGYVCDTTAYNLVFFDYFNGTELDTNKWKTYIPDGPNGSDQCQFCRTHTTEMNNAENQIYRDRNVRIEDGYLYLDVFPEEGEWYGLKKDYASGIIYSKRIHPSKCISL